MQQRYIKKCVRMFTEVPFIIAQTGNNLNVNVNRIDKSTVELPIQ